MSEESSIRIATLSSIDYALTMQASAMCPACGAPVERSSKQLTVDEVAARLCPPARDRDRFDRMKQALSKLWKADHVCVVVCSKCRLGFVDPVVEGDEEFYSILHERVGYPTNRWEFDRARKFLSGIERPARVLDVGAGAGDFLGSVDAKHDRHAIEASDVLRKSLETKSIRAHRTIDEIDLQFDLITMFHVIQYFSDPVSMLSKVRRLLMSNGKLMLSVPNAEAVGTPDDLVSPPHPLTRWNRTAIECAFARAGLAIEEIAYIPQPMSSLMWGAHAGTRAAILRNPRGISARVDAMESGRIRNNLLKLIGLTHLPSVLLTARSRLYRSQILVIARAS